MRSARYETRVYQRAASFCLLGLLLHLDIQVLGESFVSVGASISILYLHLIKRVKVEKQRSFKLFSFRKILSTETEKAKRSLSGAQEVGVLEWESPPPPPRLPVSTFY